MILHTRSDVSMKICTMEILVMQRFLASMLLRFFHAWKEGAITTNCDELAAKLRIMRNFGFQEQDNSILVGINAKMNEISATYGLVSLSDLNETIERNKNNFETYCNTFAEFSKIEFFKSRHKKRCKLPVCSCKS